jgi:hypothetical protein
MRQNRPKILAISDVRSTTFGHTHGKGPEFLGAPMAHVVPKCILAGHRGGELESGVLRRYAAVS